MAEGGVGGRAVTQVLCSSSSYFSVERFIRGSFNLGFVGSTCAAIQQLQLLRHQSVAAQIVLFLFNFFTLIEPQGASHGEPKRKLKLEVTFESRSSLYMSRA